MSAATGGYPARPASHPATDQHPASAAGYRGPSAVAPGSAAAAVLRWESTGPGIQSIYYWKNYNLYRLYALNILYILNKLNELNELELDKLDGLYGWNLRYDLWMVSVNRDRIYRTASPLYPRPDNIVARTHSLHHPNTYLIHTVGILPPEPSPYNPLPPRLPLSAHPVE